MSPHRPDALPGARGLRRDFEGTLRAVAAIGYEGVEVFDLHGHPAGEVRGWLDELGLVGDRPSRAARGDRGRARRSWPTRRVRSAGGGSSSAGSIPPTLGDAELAGAGSARRGRRARRTGSSSATTTTTPSSSARTATFLDQLLADRSSSSSSISAGRGSRASIPSSCSSGSAPAARSCTSRTSRAATGARSARSATASSATTASCPPPCARGRRVADRRAGRDRRRRSSTAAAPLARTRSIAMLGGDRMNVGIVGCGVISRHYAENAGGVRLVRARRLRRPRSARARRRSARRTASRVASIDELLADPRDRRRAQPDAVRRRTRAVTRAALEAGKHVYTEKPLATTCRRALELVARGRAARAADRLRAGHLPRRRLPGRPRR